MVAVTVTALLACSSGGDGLTIYSGRSETLVSPLLAAFIEDTGIEIQVKYASSAAIAATILEEGENSPAGVAFLQDPGYLGSLANAGMFAELPQELLNRVDGGYRSAAGEWVGISGRSRTVVYNTVSITKEYPLVEGVPADPGLPVLSSLEPPDVDLGELTDSRGTISLLREVGIIP